MLHDATHWGQYPASIVRLEGGFNIAFDDHPSERYSGDQGTDFMDTVWAVFMRQTRALKSVLVGAAASEGQT